jgi:hypothetical protein
LAYKVGRPGKHHLLSNDLLPLHWYPRKRLAFKIRFKYMEQNGAFFRGHSLFSNLSAQANAA